MLVRKSLDLQGSTRESREFLKQQQEQEAAAKAAVERARLAPIKAYEALVNKTLAETIALEEQIFTTQPEEPRNVEGLLEAPSYMVDSFDAHQWGVSAKMGFDLAKQSWIDANIPFPDERETEMMLRWFMVQKPLPNPESQFTWELCLYYMTNRGLRTRKVIPVTVPDTGDSTEVTDPLAGLVGRARENKEHEIYCMDVLKETVQNPVYNNAIQELVDASGLTMSTKHNVAFRLWLGEQTQRRRYTNTREDIRFAAAEFFGDSVINILDPIERAELDRRKVVGTLSSDDVKAIVGSRNTYNPTEGYAARRSQ